MRPSAEGIDPISLLASRTLKRARGHGEDNHVFPQSAECMHAPCVCVEYRRQLPQRSSMNGRHIHTNMHTYMLPTDAQVFEVAAKF